MQRRELGTLNIHLDRMHAESLRNEIVKRDAPDFEPRAHVLEVRNSDDRHLYHSATYSFRNAAAVRNRSVHDLNLRVSFVTVS